MPARIMKESSLKNLRPPWKPGQSGNPRGKAKNTATECYKAVMTKAAVKRMHNLTSTEIDEWENFVISCTIEDMQVLVKTDQVPAYPRGLMMAILTELKNGQCRTLEKLRDRQHGKAIKHEITGANGEALIPERNLTPSQAKDFLEALQNSV